MSSILEVIVSALVGASDVVSALAPGILALLGGFLGSLVSRKSAGELDVRWRREESLRMLRWSVEMINSPDQRSATMGRKTLEALLDSGLLQEVDKPFARDVAEAARTRLNTVVRSQDQPND
jgi:hypothetical protein